MVGTLCTEQALLKLILNGNHILSNVPFVAFLYYTVSVTNSVYFICLIMLLLTTYPLFFNSFSLSATNHIDTLYS